MAYNHINQDTTNNSYTTALETIGMQAHSSFAVQVASTDTTPSSGTFTANVDDTLTKTAHGMITGLAVQVSSTTTLPGGLSAATEYHVIYLTADTFKLASSLANSLAGTAIDITSTGSGTHTITPTALSGASVKIQESVDGSNWFDISGTSTNITATGTQLITGTTKCGQIRSYLTLPYGQLSNTIKVNLK